ncbi:MAG TPA: lipoyl synthase [Thermoplasmata archaeon]|nr:lipoyl synthase [Thermoplasmata archaeon]
MASSSASMATGIRPGPLPEWIRVRPPLGAQYPEVRDLLRELHLGTVCREARCPNLPECWSAGAATLMLLGTDCTRRCGFCAVTTHWPRGVVDATEPARVAEAVARWGLRYVVLTQVCRDDLSDGGAAILAETVRDLRARTPSTLVELLIGDLAGDPEALATVLADPPDVLAHNLETTRALSRGVRDPRAGYDRSLAVLAEARARGPRRLVTKSSIMLGLGERDDDLASAFRDLRSAGVDLLTLGQYLRPSADHLPVDRYVTPEEFGRWKSAALAAGFAGVEAGPLVRSSYHAEELYRRAFAARGA